MERLDKMQEDIEGLYKGLNFANIELAKLRGELTGTHLSKEGGVISRLTEVENNYEKILNKFTELESKQKKLYLIGTGIVLGSIIMAVIFGYISIEQALKIIK